MSQAVRDYLLGVVATALLAGVLLTLTPKGAVHRALTFLCGLAIILAALGPIARLDFEAMAQSLARTQVGAAASAGEIQADNEALISAIIKEQTESYIWDKAGALGLSLSRVEAEIQTGGAYPYPYSVRISGTWTPEARDRLRRLVEQELAIPAARQEWHTDEET